MKQCTRRLLCLALCAVMLLSAVPSVSAVSCRNYSDWFKPNYNEMKELNLIPASFEGYDLKKNITRAEMCALAVHAYGLITKNAIELERTDYFSDTTDPTILMAYELGIVSGYPDGTFQPDKPLTRQEFFKIIQNFCNAVAYHPSVDGANLSKFADVGKLSTWAVEAAKICVKCEYVNGTKTSSGLSLNPGDNTSRQEAMAMFLRCFKGLRQYYFEVVLSATVVDDEVYDPNVTIAELSGTRYVNTETLNVRDSWSSGSTKVGTLSFGAKVMAMCTNNVKTRDGGNIDMSARILWRFAGINTTGRKRLHAGHARPERQRRHGYRAVRDVLHRLFLRLRRRKSQDRFRLLRPHVLLPDAVRL